MRAIKFRQRIKGTLSSTGETSDHWRYWGYIDAERPDWFEPPLSAVEWDKRESQQFTGLKDGNGKEIFEGDVLRASEKNPILEIVFWNPQHAAWELEEMSEGDFYPLARYASKHEVIGNVFENPELLKAQ